MTALGLSDEQQPVEQLQSLAVEHAEVDQALVLDALPAPDATPALLEGRHRDRA
jgi:hypothetical protein